MSSKKAGLLLKLLSSFFLDLSAAFLIAILAPSDLLSKVNSIIFSGMCFGIAYFSASYIDEK